MLTTIQVFWCMVNRSRPFSVSKQELFISRRGVISQKTRNLRVSFSCMLFIYSLFLLPLLLLSYFRRLHYSASANFSTNFSPSMSLASYHPLDIQNSASFSVPSLCQEINSWWSDWPRFRGRMVAPFRTDLIQGLHTSQEDGSGRILNFETWQGILDVRR